MTTNPWITSVDDAPSALETRPVVVDMAPSGPGGPQGGVDLPANHAPFPRRSADGRARLWLVGAHGGAGETTLAQIVPGAMAADHAWPADDSARVLLLARTHASGLEAAQRAAVEWAAGEANVDLLGLLLIPDAPGRLPRALRDLAIVVRGGFPRAWDLPWIEGWRSEVGDVSGSAGRSVRRLLRDLNVLAPVTGHE